MHAYDAIVIGNGLTGAALSYELAKAGLRTLLMDDGNPHSGTRYSYGGIGYWAGTTDMTNRLFPAGLVRHRELLDELDADTQLRELDLLLTVEKGADIEALKADYGTFQTPPQFVDTAIACEMEPRLNPDAIDGAFTIRHAHVDPMSVVAAYNQAFRKIGGHHQIAEVTGLVKIGQRITGITTQSQATPAGAVFVAAGAYTRQILHSANITVPLYFTHAEIVETTPIDITLRCFVMPATNARLVVETKATDDQQWQKESHQVMPPVMEAGVVQFQDGSARLGQISRFHTAYQPPVSAEQSESQLREAINHILPKLGDVPGTWRHCLVSYTQDGLPLCGPIPNLEGLHLFSGFTGPFTLVPSVAQRYANHLTQTSDPLMEALSIKRFEQTVSPSS